MSHDLETRLRAAELTFAAPEGAHLDDERLAEIAEGCDPTTDEAMHLAGCDACLAVLSVVGPGLAELDAPSAVPLAPPRRAGWAVGTLAFLAAAAAALWLRVDAPEAPPAAPPADAGRPDARIIDAAGVVTEPDAAVLVDQGVVAPPDAGALVDASAPAAERPARPRRRPRPTRARPASTFEHARLAGSGPRRMTRRPVNGAPRGYGYLRLTSKPSARVFVDGKPIGWTPVIDRRLPEGPHDVRLVYESPLAAESEQRLRVMIETDRIWKVVRRNLKR